MNIEEFLDRLNNVKRVGVQWTAECPVHHGQSLSSLGVRETYDGKILVICRAGCDVGDIVAELGLTLRDLRGDDWESDRFTVTRWEPSSDVDYAAPSIPSWVVATYTYTDSAGEPLYDIERMGPVKSFRIKPNDFPAEQRVLFNLPQINWAREHEAVIWKCEGEKDALTLIARGFVATTCAFGVGGWLPQYVEQLRGARVAIVADDDDPGHEHARAVYADLLPVAKELWLLVPPHGAAKDVTEMIERGLTVADLVPLPVETPWVELVPLESDRGLPEFPVDMLPGWIATMVRQVAASTQTPPGFVAMVALGGLSAVLGGKVVARLRPDWTEPCVLFVLPVMPPASRKSVVFRIVLEPIDLAEKQLVEAARPKMEQLEAKLRDLMARELKESAILATSTVKAAKGKDVTDDDKAGKTATEVADQSAENKAQTDIDVTREAISETRALLKPLPVLRVGDCTPEKLAELIATHGHVSMLAAEAGGLTTALGKRYGASSFFDVLLMGHAGDALSMERRGRDSLRIDRTLLTIAVTAQPSFLEDLASDSQARGRGVLARFLILQPPDLVGSRPFSAPTIDPKVIGRWRDTLQEMAVRIHTAPPTERTFARDALAMFDGFHNRVEARMRASGDLAHVRDWVGKSVGAAARIAAILSAVDTKDLEVSARYARAGVAIMEVLVEHFLAFIDGAAISSRIRDARDLWARIQRGADGKCPEQFTLREIRRWIPRLCVEEGEPKLKAALAVLVENGYIRELPRSKGRGRPSVEFQVRPELR